MKKQPDWVCYDCGVKFGKDVKGRVSTFNRNNCGVCGKVKAVTDPRNYGYLDLEEVERWRQHCSYFDTFLGEWQSNSRPPPCGKCYKNLQWHDTREQAEERAKTLEKNNEIPN